MLSLVIVSVVVLGVMVVVVVVVVQVDDARLMPFVDSLALFTC